MARDAVAPRRKSFNPLVSYVEDYDDADDIFEDESEEERRSVKEEPLIELIVGRRPLSKKGRATPAKTVSDVKHSNCTRHKLLLKDASVNGDLYPSGLHSLDEDDGTSEAASASALSSHSSRNDFKNQGPTPKFVGKVSSSADFKKNHLEKHPDAAKFEYLVKWRNKSYLHVDWIERDMILEDVEGDRRLRRFIKQLIETKDDESNTPSHDGEYFDPSFTQVERILDVYEPGYKHRLRDDSENFVGSMGNSMYYHHPGHSSSVHMAASKRNGQSDSYDDVNQIDQRELWTGEAIHLLSYLREYTFRGFALGQYFAQPVDPLRDGAPNYFEIIKHPMDFETVQNKLIRGDYSVLEHFASDVRLIFSNCLIYNPDPELQVNFSARKLSSIFEARLLALNKQQPKTIVNRNNHENSSMHTPSLQKRQYLIKWKGLGYGDMTWEDEDVVSSDDVVASFYRRYRVPAFSGNGNDAFSIVKYEVSPDFKNGRHLRSYQLEGLNWLVFNHSQGRGSILADEMGLGKTCQTVSFCSHLVSRSNKPCLIIAPLSTLGHWKREFESWTDINVVLYHDMGNRFVKGYEARGLIRDTEFYFWQYDEANRKWYTVPNVYKFQVLLTSYEAMTADASFLSSISYECVVIDEGHRLKSRSSKLAQTLREYVKANSRVILTGTPLQNNVKELFNLLNFVEPTVFVDEDAFLAEFGDLKRADQVTALQSRVRPYMLRRLKEHVEKDIPDKEETVIDVELTTLQKKYYRAIFERNRNFLSTSSQSAAGGINARQKITMKLTNVEMELRKCCNHPFLVKGTKDREAEAKYGSMDKVPADSTAEALKDMIQSSGKMVLLDKLLSKLRKENRKVLVFSQFKMMLDIIELYCRHPNRRYPVERIDGNISRNERQKAIDRYSQNENSFVFLLSTRAGGVGINLTAADTVIIYCSDWNPMNDLQAMARCHRIGQTSAVKIYRFVTKNTYEAHLFNTAAKKLGLEKAVLGSGSSSLATGSDSISSGMDVEEQLKSNGPLANQALRKEEIEQLLRYGAYKLLEGDSDAAEKAKQFNEADIDDLLKRESRTVKWSVNDKLNAQSAISTSFSKASFVAADTETDINVNDPSFWTKVLGKDPRSTLVARLSDGSALKSEETKLKFFDELRSVGGQVIQSKLEGEVAPDFESELMACLVQISKMRRTFSDQEQSAAEQLMKQVERPSRRSYTAKDVVRFYEHERIQGIDDKEVCGDDDTEEELEIESPALDEDTDVSSGSETYYSGDEDDQLMCKIRGRLQPILTIRNQAVHPVKLRQHVKEAGGYRACTTNRKWTSIHLAMGFTEYSNCGYALHRIYRRYFMDDPEMPHRKSTIVRRQQLRKKKELDLSSRKKVRPVRAKTKSTKKKSSAPKKRASVKLKRASCPPPIERLDPKTYSELDKNEEPWCRYCGAVESSGWSRGPWGSRTLCIVHYVEWFQKKTLDLSEFEGSSPPMLPINPDVNTQFKYLWFKKEKVAREEKELDFLEISSIDDSEQDVKDLGESSTHRSRRKSLQQSKEEKGKRKRGGPKERGQEAPKSNLSKKRKAESDSKKSDKKPGRRNLVKSLVPDSKVSKDCTTDVCALCSEGGKLFICEGQCKRGFHPQCLDAEIRKNAEREDKEWLCSDCESGCYVCLTCGESGYTDEKDGILPCQDLNCGRFTHLHCVKKDSRGKVIDAGQGLIFCPLHICSVCHDTKRGSSIFCVRCNNGYHRKCLESTDALVLHQNLCICPSHLSDIANNNSAKSSSTPGAKTDDMVSGTRSTRSRRMKSSV